MAWAVPCYRRTAEANIRTTESRVIEPIETKRKSLLRLFLLGGLALSLGGCGYRPVSETGPGPVPDAESEPAPGTGVPPAPPQDAVIDIAVGERARQDRYASLRTGDGALPADKIGYFVDVQEGRLRQVLTGTPIRMQRIDDRLLLTIPGRLSFETDSTKVVAAAEPVLGAIAAVLVEFDKTLVSVFGHTDDRGDAAYNQSLSERRAIAVARFLADEGVARQRLAGIGYGQRRPAFEDESERARTANRRIEILIEPIPAGP